MADRESSMGESSRSGAQRGNIDPGDESSAKFHDAPLITTPTGAASTGPPEKTGEISKPSLEEEFEQWMKDNGIYYDPEAQRKRLREMDEAIAEAENDIRELDELGKRIPPAYSVPFLEADEVFKKLDKIIKVVPEAAEVLRAREAERRIGVPYRPSTTATRPRSSDSTSLPSRPVSRGVSAAFGSGYLGVSALEGHRASSVTGQATQYVPAGRTLIEPLPLSSSPLSSIIQGLGTPSPWDLDDEMMDLPDEFQPVHEEVLSQPRVQQQQQVDAEGSLQSGAQKQRLRPPVIIVTPADDAFRLLMNSVVKLAARDFTDAATILTGFNKVKASIPPVDKAFLDDLKDEGVASDTLRSGIAFLINRVAELTNTPHSQVVDDAVMEIKLEAELAAHSAAEEEARMQGGKDVGTKRVSATVEAAKDVAEDTSMRDVGAGKAQQAAEEGPGAIGGEQTEEEQPRERAGEEERAVEEQLRERAAEEERAKDGEGESNQPVNTSAAMPSIEYGSTAGQASSSAAPLVPTAHGPIIAGIATVTTGVTKQKDQQYIFSKKVVGAEVLRLDIKLMLKPDDLRDTASLENGGETKLVAKVHEMLLSCVTHIYTARRMTRWCTGNDERCFGQFNHGRENKRFIDHDWAKHRKQSCDYCTGRRIPCLIIDRPNDRILVLPTVRRGNALPEQLAYWWHQ